MAKKNKDDKPKKEANPKRRQSRHGDPLVCGVVMPISETDGLPASHWSDVRVILDDAIETAGFAPKMVSEEEYVGVIHKHIVTNLGKNPIVVCDVSGRNANVMFELGLRLAFDKATVIVKDDSTEFSFDTAPIEHIGYPRSLRHREIEEFKKKLVAKMQATHKQATDEPQFSMFVKHFGDFKVAELETTVLPKSDFIIQELAKLNRRTERMIDQMSRLKIGSPPPPRRATLPLQEVADLSDTILALMTRYAEGRNDVNPERLTAIILADLLGNPKQLHASHMTNEELLEFVRSIVIDELPGTGS